MWQLALEMDGALDHGIGAVPRIWMWSGNRHLLRACKGREPFTDTDLSFRSHLRLLGSRITK